MISRRAALAILLGSLDPERLLWRPKLISIPRTVRRRVPRELLVTPAMMRYLESNPSRNLFNPAFDVAKFHRETFAFIVVPRLGAPW